MPFLELKSDKGTERVMLGSMRYLLERNFNPKAGSIAVVKGFRVNDFVFARSVEIPAEKVTIQLGMRTACHCGAGDATGGRKTEPDSNSTRPDWVPSSVRASLRIPFSAEVEATKPALR